MSTKYVFNPFTGNLDAVKDDTLTLNDKRLLQTSFIESILISVDNTGIEPITKVLTNEEHVLYKELES